MKFRVSTKKSLSDISSEWDAIAPLRDRQIEHNIDTTYHNIICPGILEKMGNVKGKKVADLGCGVGGFLGKVISLGAVAYGVDISPVSISIAGKKYGKNAKLYNASIEDFANTINIKFDFAIINMVLSNIYDIDNCFSSAKKILNEKGVVIFSVTHPAFWPRYLEYDCEEWYSYSKTISIDGPFTITNDRNATFQTTHIHRPLEVYYESLHRTGLVVKSISELPRADKFPRILIGAAAPRT